MPYYSTDVTWSTWTGGTMSACTADCTTTATWSGWNNTTASTSAYTTSTAWTNWVDLNGTAADGSGAWITWISAEPGGDYSTQYGTLSYPPPETEDQKVARLKQEKIQHQSWEAAEKVRLSKEKAKEEKARQLLREVITPEQDQQLEKDGYFELVSVKSGHRYRIHKGRAGNVQQLDDLTGNPIKKLCFHPNEYVHNYDTMVAQKLMLENDEEQVLRVANFS